MRLGHRPAQPTPARLRRNRLWLEVVALAADLTAWTQMLVFKDHPARRWERNGSACASSRPPHAWPAADGGSGSGSPATGPGPT